ncbi:defects in morphology protein 1 [Seiridium cupressi]
MATKFRVTDHPEAPESDYGSDFSLEEESIVIQLLESIQADAKEGALSQRSPSSSVLQTDLDAAIAAGLFASSSLDEFDHEDVSAALVGAERNLQGQVKTPAGRYGALGDAGVNGTMEITSMPMDGIEYPDLSRALSKLDHEPLPNKSPPTTNDNGSPAEDRRSPIERFRSFPKKPLTVSDISSGAWCELQYWYTLTQLPGGKKTRTAAMKGGTKVHQRLEDQVHTTVQVNVSLKEEAFALRLWNFIQGLRTLRDTGLTRELEVWGLVEGQVVNGVIDEISYTSPNLGFEEELSQSQSSQDGTSEFAEKQSSITQYFDPHQRRIYLTDVKTRGSTRLPTGAALRPSRVQLFMYHRLLGEMAAGRLDFSTIVARYGLQLDVRFSDAFMAQIGSLHDEVFDELEPGADALSMPSKQTGTGYPDPSPKPDAETSPPPDLIRYRSIKQILPLVQSELRETFPQGASTLGDLVAVVYRHRDDGRIIGNHSFPTDAAALSNYLKLDLAWWLGKRNPDGVPIEEAYKCRMCEFADSCDWRRERNEEIVRKSRRQAGEGA